MELEQLTAIVQDTTFRNDDNGYTVLHAVVGRTEHTIVGILPELSPGENVTFEGRWTEHPTYGRQFSANKCTITPPTGKSAIEKYLGSGLIRGIGPSTAKLIVNHFGEDAMALISRIVTVDGDCVKRPRNILAPIGTRVTDLVEFCGGLVREPKKIINGGPMMGAAQWDTEMPVTKSTSAVLLFSESFGKKSVDTQACIRCGKCIRNCPMHLMPMYIAQFSRIHDLKRAEEYGAMNCVECGSCSYNCPGGVEIVQHIRVAKAAIKAEKTRLASLAKPEK